MQANIIPIPAKQPKRMAYLMRVVQYCDIMRFTIIYDRHHKVSPSPNP